MNYNDKNNIQTRFFYFQIEKSVRASRQIKIFDDIAKMMNFRYRQEIVEIYDPVNVNLDGDLLHSAYPFHPDFYQPNFLGPMFRVK